MSDQTVRVPLYEVSLIIQGAAIVWWLFAPSEDEAKQVVVERGNESAKFEQLTARRIVCCDEIPYTVPLQKVLELSFPTGFKEKQ